MHKNQAAYMVNVKQIEIHDIPMPEPKPDELLLKTAYVGICGSDVHFFKTGERKGKAFDLPFILGHECAGTVAAVGSENKKFKVGDQVCFEPQITCGTCFYCRSGRYNMCPDVIFPSTPPYDGVFRNYLTIPERLAYRLPENVSLKEGALIEPLAVGLAAAERGEVSLGSTVVILGAGCIGLLTMLACKARGASKVIMCDLYKKRLDNAVRLGADAVINAQEQDVLACVLELTNGEGADVVFEAASTPFTAAETVDLIKRCGIIVMVGNVNGTTPYRFMDLMYKEAQIRTIYRYRSNFDTAIQSVESGRIHIEDIISHQFDFNDIQAAFETSLNNPRDVIKVIVKM